MAHKCTPNSKSSHRIRKAHTEFEKLTPNSKSPHRIRKAHTEFEQPTPNSKSPHRIRKAHTEFERPTPNSKTSYRIPKPTPNSQTSHRIRHSISKSLHRVSRQTHLQSTLTSFYPSNPSRDRDRALGAKCDRRSLWLSACDCNWNFSLFCEHCGNIHNPCANYCSKCGSGKKIFLFMLF